MSVVEEMNSAQGQHKEYLASLFEWGGNKYEGYHPTPTEAVYEYFHEENYLSTPENTTDLEALNGYFFQTNSNEIEPYKTYELIAALALNYLNHALWVIEEYSHPDEIEFPLDLCQRRAAYNLLQAWQALNKAEKFSKTNQIEQTKLLNQELIRKEERTRNARNAAKAKQSPYEKAGTIEAVNKLLVEKRELLHQRGGKAALNKMILDLIVNGDISAPNTPTPKTVDSWIDKFRNTETN